jgi:hypothetical protein
MKCKHCGLEIRWATLRIPNSRDYNWWTHVASGSTFCRETKAEPESEAK